MIVDLPDNATPAAASLAVSATRAARCPVTVLLTPEEADGATGKTASFRPPGA